MKPLLPEELPTDAETLADLHKLFSEERQNLLTLQSEVDQSIHAICIARAFALYGVRKDSIISCPLRGKKCKVLDFVWFHNFDKKPTLAVDGGRGYPENSSCEWEVVKS